MSVSPHRHLIIAGTTRAATTSLFEYLGDHPQVSRSSIKESRFFLGGNYPLPRHLPADAPLGDYLQLFNDPENNVCLEATPDYLYCATAAKRIHEELPNAKLVFILREPIERLISWYRYAKQNNQLDGSITLDQYIQTQCDAAPPTPDTPQHMRSLAQGLYSEYLKAYLDLFNKDQCLILRYDQIKAEPRQTLKAISRHAGIAPGFFDTYRFDVLNASVHMRSQGLHAAYKRLAWTIRSKAVHHPGLHQLLRKVRRTLHPAYMKINQRQESAKSSDGISDETRAFLTDYYKHEPDALRDLTGEDFSAWQTTNSPQPAMKG